MYGEEQVSIVPVGNLGPFLKSDENVRSPRHHHFDDRTVFIDESLEAEGDVKIDFTLISLPVRTKAARILPTVSRVNANCPETHSIIVTQCIRLR